jgi:hypothetical protein
MKMIKCKYCGKSYASPSEMRKRKCHSHPKGAWGGYCTPSPLEESNWKVEKFSESQMSQLRELDDIINERKRKESEFRREYKRHTPLLDCMLGKDLVGDEPDEDKLEIRNSDLHQLALDLANGINKGKENRDAINTIYALRNGCDYVLNNADAQKDGPLNSWLDEVKLLKDEVISWDFWVALYWLTKTIKEKADAAKDDFEDNRDNFNYWQLNSIAQLFYARQVMPMLRVLGVVRKDNDVQDKKIKNAIEVYIRKLKLTEKGFSRILAMLERRIAEGSFWGVLYSLHWMRLRPTPWNDQKVWPIQAAW